MSARSLRLLPACALVALAVVGAAGASNSASFTDRLSDKVDVYEGVDIIGLQVSNDDAGILTFHVTVAGHKKKLGYNDGMIDVLLDLDQNPDTRSIYYGTEVGFELQSSGIGFLRLRGATIRGAPRPPSLHGAFSNGTASFTVKAADLGLAPSAGFNVPVRAVADWAPDYRSFNYQMVPGTPPLDPGPDTRAPFVHAMSSVGHHRYGAELNYRAGRWSRQDCRCDSHLARSPTAEGVPRTTPEHESVRLVHRGLADPPQGSPWAAALLRPLL